MNIKDCRNIYISKSKVDGIGIFTDSDIKKNEIFCCAIKDNNITYYGSKVNHCITNKNVDLQKKNNDYYFVAINDIKKNDEILMDYTDSKVPGFIDKRTDGFINC